MSIEKPISTIKKAIQRMAEENARKDLKDKPEQKHFDDVFASYKLLRMLEPERLELYLKVSAKYQELKNEIGSELFEIFDSAWGAATKDGENDIKSEVDQLATTFKLLFPKEYAEELEKIDKRYLDNKAEQVKNSPQIVRAFSGKDELLDKAIETVTSSMLNLMKYNRDSLRDK